MFTDSDSVTTVVAIPNRTWRASKLLQAVALAAALVLVGGVSAQADTIICGVDEGGCFGVGYYTNLGGLQSNTWEFWDSHEGPTPSGLLRYSFTISGTPTSTFALDVTDTWTWPFYQVSYQGNTLDCVVNDSGIGPGGSCTMFGVSLAPESQTPAWEGGGYDVSILWRTLGESIPSNQITILRNPDDPNGRLDFSFLSAVALTDIRYAPNLTPPDPGIGGRGDSFSTFGVFEGPGTTLPAARIVNNKADLLVTVPEPTSLLLLGTGLAGLAVRARRRKK